MKRIINIIIFVLILFAVVLRIEQIIPYKERGINQYKSFYETDKMKMDIVFVGSSIVYRSYIPIEIMNKYKINTYVLGEPNMYYKNAYYMIKEAISRNKPKLIVYDIYTHFNSDEKQINRAKIYNMIPSINKLDALKDIYNIACIDSNCTNIEYLSSYNQFHSRWKELEFYDFGNNRLNVFYGYPVEQLVFNKYKIIDRKINIDNVNTILNEEQLEYIDKIYDYCIQHNVRILFTYPSNISQQWEYKIAKTFAKYAKSKKMDFINFYEHRDQINIDYKNDLYDAIHFNYYGAKKFQDYSIPLYIKTYNIDIGGINKNNDMIKKYFRAVNNEEVKKCDDINLCLQKMMYDDYIIIIAGNGNAINRIDKKNLKILNKYGILKDIRIDKQNYLLIIDNNKKIYEKISDDVIKYSDRYKNIMKIYVELNDNNIIKISGRSYIKNENSLNIVVYDKINKQVVDSIWLDPNYPDEIKR